MFQEIYKPFLIILVLSLIQQFSGMSVLRAYVVKIFNEVFENNNGNRNITNLMVDNGGANYTSIGKSKGFKVIYW